MLQEINTHELLSYKTIIAAIIGAGVTFVVAITSSVISLITNNKNRKLIKEVELLKIELQKDIISYQIYLSELSKMKFERLDELYQILIEYVDFYKNKISTDYGLINNPEDLIRESYQINSKTGISYRKTKIYLRSRDSRARSPCR